MPYLILLAPAQRRPQGVPRVVRFRHVVTVGRSRRSHVVTGPGDTHHRHFAVVSVGPEYVIYDHDDVLGTFLGWSGAEHWWRLGGGPAYLEDRMLVRAGRLLFQFVDTRGSTVAPFPDLMLTAGCGWAWARGPSQLPVAVRVPRDGLRRRRA